MTKPTRLMRSEIHSLRGTRKSLTGMLYLYSNLLITNQQNKTNIWYMSPVTFIKLSLSAILDHIGDYRGRDWLQQQDFKDILGQ